MKASERTLRFSMSVRISQEDDWKERNGVNQEYTEVP